MGSSHAAGSTVGEKVENNTITINWLAADIRKNLINIETLAQVVEDVSLRSESDTKKDDNQDQKLDDIHITLLDIGNALSLDFANRIAGMKEQEDELRGAKSRRRFRREESQLEKSSKNVGNIITRTGSKMISPFQDIFGKIISFLGVLGTGIVVNEAFKWLSDPENQAKIGKFFKILVKNWKLIVGTIGVLVGAALIGPLISSINALGVMAKVLAPLLLFAAGSDKGIEMMEKVAERVFDKKIDLKSGVGPNDTKPFTKEQLMKVDGISFDEYLKSQEGGANEANILALIARLEKEKENINYWNPLNLLYSTEDQYTRKIEYLKQLLKKTRSSGNLNKVEKNTINNINKNITNTKIDAISKKPGINLIPMDLPAITAKMPEISTPSGPATEAPDIASTNGADQYRYITSSIYGIFV